MCVQLRQEAAEAEGRARVTRLVQAFKDVQSVRAQEEAQRPRGESNAAAKVSIDLPNRERLASGRRIKSHRLLSCPIQVHSSTAPSALIAAGGAARKGGGGAAVVVPAAVAASLVHQPVPPARSGLSSHLSGAVLRTHSRMLLCACGEGPG
jgi:hypothetical protein